MNKNNEISTNYKELENILSGKLKESTDPVRSLIEAVIEQAQLKCVDVSPPTGADRSSPWY